METSGIIIRQAVQEDAPGILALIRELALYEKAPHEVTNTEEDLVRDGFGENPAFSCLVAELDGKIIGISLFYVRYSTWKGKMLYLEDIIVTESQRGKGTGDKLFRATAAEAHRLQMNGMIWQVLEWNTPAIRFYEKYGAIFDTEWTNVKLSKNRLSEL